MSAEEVASQIASVDRRLRDGLEVDAADKSINLTSLYRRYGWSGGGPSPLPGDAQKKLNIGDRTSDDRWSAHFLGNGRHLGVYRSQIGYYWLLRYDGAMSEHWLDHAGTAFDVEQRFGKSG